MQIYKYDPLTRELIGQNPAQKRPGGEWITDVLNGTAVEPPALKDRQAAVWNGTGWDVVEDHRQKTGLEGSGTPYWLPGDTWQSAPRYKADLGPLPREALLEAPQRPEEDMLAEAASAARFRRDSLLSATDYLLMPDYPISEESLKLLKAYRQALRDIPEQEGFPLKLVWPDRPSIRNGG